MWPSEETASRLYDLANWGLITGLVVGVVSTILVVWMGNAKETYLRTRLSDTTERTVKAELGLATAHEGIAVAQAEAAKANLLAEQERLARVKIEERLAWRRISPKQHDEFVHALKQFSGSILIVAAFSNADVESKTFAADISHALNDAKWSAPLNLSNTSSDLPVGIICRLDTSKPAGMALKLIVQKLPGAVIITTRLTDAKEAIGSIVVGLRPPP